MQFSVDTTLSPRVRVDRNSSSLLLPLDMVPSLVTMRLNGDNKYSNFYTILWSELGSKKALKQEVEIANRREMPLFARKILAALDGWFERRLWLRGYLPP